MAEPVKVRVGQIAEVIVAELVGKHVWVHVTALVHILVQNL